VESDIAAPPETAGPRQPDRAAVDPHAAPGHRWWLLVAVLAVVASGIVGARVQHANDARNAAHDLYRTQLLTTVSLFSNEEGRQIALPVAQRDMTAFENLARSLDADPGPNGQGGLTVTLGSGSAAEPGQIAFSITVASQYASTTFVVWYIHIPGQNNIGPNIGACVQWSTLLGPGRATTDLSLGAGYPGIPHCLLSYWSAGPVTLKQPRLGLTPILPSPR
jgi:hypothetical protein